jgi:hypothetical protein
MPDRPIPLALRGMLAAESARPGLLSHPGYTLAVVVRIVGRLDPAVLQQAFQDLVDRHELLRSRLVIHGAAGHLEPEEHVEARLKVIEAGSEDVDRLYREWQSLRVALNGLPVLRGQLAVLGAEDHLLGLSIHHLLSDDTTSRILVRELALLYRARSEGRSAKPLPLQYWQYAQWQSGRLASRFEADRAAWAGYLDGVATVHYTRDLPFVPGSVPDARISRETILPPAETGELAALARRRRGSMMILLLAVFAESLAQRADSTDLMFHTTFEQRDHPDARSTVGTFLYPVMLRVDIGDGGWDEVFARTRASVLHAHNHAQFPFHEAIAMAPALVPAMAGREPAWVVAFSYNDVDDAERFDFGSATAALLGSVGNQSGQAEPGLGLRLQRDAAGALVARFNYDANDIKGTTAQSLLDDFRRRLRSLLP